MLCNCIYIISYKLMMHLRTKYTYCLCYLKVIIIFSISFSKRSVMEDIILLAMCDAPKPGGPLTTRQPAENLFVSYHETHT